MTLQMLEYFIALVEKESFTEAANACFVSQPALSRAIAGLEKEIGCPLVTRGKTVMPTPAGEVLRVEAQRILGQIEVMVERVQQAQQGVRGTLTLGYIAYGMLQAFRKNAQDAFDWLKEEGIRLETVYDSVPQIQQRLMSGELDAALLPENCTWNLPHCRTCIVSTMENKVMVPKEHPLFDSKSISLRQLSDSRFVFFSPDEMPMVLAKHVSMCRDAGFSPEIAGYGRKVGDVVDLLHQHSAVSIATCAFDYTESEALRLIPMEEKYKTSLMLVIRERSVSPSGQKLFDRLSEENEA